MSDINVTIEDEQPIVVTIEDEQPVTVTIQGGMGGSGTSYDIYSSPPSGCYQIVNLYLDASLNIVVVYNDVAVS